MANECEGNGTAKEKELKWEDIVEILGNDPDFSSSNLTADPPLDNDIDNDYRHSIPEVDQNLPNNIFQPENVSAIENNSPSASSQGVHIQQHADSSLNNPQLQDSLESDSIVHMSDEPRGMGFARTRDEWLKTGNTTMSEAQFLHKYITKKSVQATTSTITTLEPMQPTSPNCNQPIVMYSLAQQSLQGSIPTTFIMQQPATLPGSGGVVPAGGSSSGSGGGSDAMLDIPNLTDMKGEYDFDIKIEEKERTMKSPMWLMSTVTNKLYTNINKAVPFEIYLGKMPAKTSQLYVKAVPVFTTPQYLRTNVTRCRNHAAITDPTNHDFPYPEYVVRADHPNARYCKGSSGRLAVEVSLDQLISGKQLTPILLRFMCLGSCVGGISRRPIAVLITLENLQGEVLGRKVIDVRVCACPTRDIKSDEQAAMGTKRKGSYGPQDKAPVVRKKPKMEPKLEVEDDHIYTIRVRGPELYTLLKNLKDTYHATHPDYTTRYPDPPQLSHEAPQRSEESEVE